MAGPPSRRRSVRRRVTTAASAHGLSPVSIHYRRR